MIISILQRNFSGRKLQRNWQFMANSPKLNLPTIFILADCCAKQPGKMFLGSIPPKFSLAKVRYSFVNSNSIHNHDTPQPLVNKIVDWLPDYVGSNFLPKFIENVTILLILMILDNYIHVFCPLVIVCMNWNTDHVTTYHDSIHNHQYSMSHHCDHIILTTAKG